MRQDIRWKQMLQPGITAIVGAGGKSTVLKKLEEYGRGLPRLVTSTTKMYEEQGACYEPICTLDEEEGLAYCEKQIQAGKTAAWFSGKDGKGKLIGLPAEMVSRIAERHPEWYILAEADGSRKKWLKAPGVHEPVIPPHTAATVGVLNLQALGLPLTEDKVYQIEQVAAIMKRKPGIVVTPFLLTRLIGHPHGLFKNSQGKKILFCTGYDYVQRRMVEALLEDLETVELDEIVLADGYRETCEIREVIERV